MPVWQQWREAVRFDAHGPGVTVLHESDELKTVLVGLHAGQQLPVHLGPAACFVFLDGDAVVMVGAEEIPVSGGGLVVVPTGANRAVRAVTDVVFVGNLGDPASERGPH